MYVCACQRGDWQRPAVDHEASFTHANSAHDGITIEPLSLSLFLTFEYEHQGGVLTMYSAHTV